MKTLNNITSQNGIWFRAVEREDGLVAEFGKQLLSRNGYFLLKEILLVPQDEKTISTRFLEQVGHRSVEELVTIFDGSRPIHKDHSILVKQKILNHFFVGLHFLEANWNYSVTYPVPKDGPVISTVVGSYYAMRMLYDKGWRDRQFLCA